MEALIFSRILLAMAVPSIFWAVMTGRLLEGESEEREETEVCTPVDSNLIRSRELCWRGAREKVVRSELKDLAEFPRNILDVCRLMPQISILKRINAKC